MCVCACVCVCICTVLLVCVDAKLYEVFPFCQCHVSSIRGTETVVIHPSISPCILTRTAYPLAVPLPFCPLAQNNPSIFASHSLQTLLIKNKAFMTHMARIVVIHCASTVSHFLEVFKFEKKST